MKDHSVSTLKYVSYTLQRKQCTSNKVILCIVTPIVKGGGETLHTTLILIR